MSETVEDIVKWVRGSCDMYDGSFSTGDGDGLADQIEAAYWRDMNTVADELARLHEEISRLRAALKPVLEVGWVEKRYNYCSGIVPTKDLNLVVREAQSIYNGEKK